MYDTVARVICVCYRSTQQDHVFAKHGCIWKGAMVIAALVGVFLNCNQTIVLLVFQLL